jgi:hypothetical protein
MTAPSNEKFYFCSDQGLAAFIWFCNCGEEVFVRVDLDAKGRPIVVFRDDLRGNPCSELSDLYTSGQAQLRDAQEFARCFQAVGYRIRAAYKRTKGAQT